jgi:hypothetical protein
MRYSENRVTCKSKRQFLFSSVYYEFRKSSASSSTFTSMCYTFACRVDWRSTVEFGVLTRTMNTQNIKQRLQMVNARCRQLHLRGVLEKVTDISAKRQEEAIFVSQLASLSDGSQTDKWSHRSLMWRGQLKYKRCNSHITPLLLAAWKNDSSEL